LTHHCLPSILPVRKSEFRLNDFRRPISLDIFQGPPFGLTHEQIQACLEQMTGQAGYGDIAQIRTSVGTVFLYSASYLDPAHASMLAEWLDVGQFNNP
jgi:hypothetical protein